MNPSARLNPLRRGHLWLQSNSGLMMRLYLLVAAVLLVAYPFLALWPAAPAAVLKEYGLSESTYRLVLAPIIVLLIIIWLAGFYGSWMIKKYSSIIRNTKDGGAINVMSNGFLIWSLSLPLSSVISSISSLTDKGHPDRLPGVTIFNNYLDLVLMALPFIIISVGSERLYNLVRHKIKPWSQKSWVFAFICFGSIYTYFTFIQGTGPINKIYYLPHWLALITIIIPYLYVWYLGLNAAYCIYQYRQNVRGRLYKNALNLLGAGIIFVMVSSIATRTITTLSSKLTSLKLTPLLIIIYALLALIGIGYLLIAAGARQLRRIEEV